MTESTLLADKARRGVEASQRRTDKREWVINRRERTRHLIKLGGLVQKAGLIKLADDDRAVLIGAFLAAKLQGEEREEAITLQRRRGGRAFENDAPLQSTLVRS